jgi:hypothetical protein
MSDKLNPAEGFSVPEGHSVTTHGLALETSVSVGASGLVVAHLGSLGDDFDRIETSFDRVDELLETTQRVARILSETRPLSLLMQPDPVETNRAIGAIVWTSCLDGLDAALSDSVARERLLGRFRKLSEHPQWLILGAAWTHGLALLQQLQSIGIVVQQAIDRQPCLFEIQRPDEPCIAAFHMQPLAQAAAPAIRAPLYRADRLRRRIAEVTEPRMFPKFFEQLLARRFPLLFFCTDATTPSLMQWPGQAAPLLPVFADLESWSRAAVELGHDPMKIIRAQLEARELFAWADKQKFGVAFGHYPADSAMVRYLPLDAWTIGRLSQDNAPKSPGWFDSLFARKPKDK